MANSIPVFISVPEGVVSVPGNSPFLIEPGKTVVVKVMTIDTNHIMTSVNLNGVQKANGVREYTITVPNVQNPVFVVVPGVTLLKSYLGEAPEHYNATYGGSVGPGNDILSTGPGGGCCGIQSMSLSMQEDGSITASLSGLKGDCLDMISVVMAGGIGVVKVASGDFRIVTWREEGPHFTITAVSIISATYEKIPTSAIFKTIPQPLYDLYTNNIILRSMQNPLEAPDSNIYIRSTPDVYGAEGGWTVQDILDTLGINANVPAAFNYHVYQLTLTRGAPIISLLHNLLPIPGMVIERIGNANSSNAFTSTYYINIAQGSGSFNGTICATLGSSVKVDTYLNTVIGLPGEPQYISMPDPDTLSDATGQNTYTLNLVKGVFSIDTSTTTVVSESASYTSTDMTSGNVQ